MQAVQQISYEIQASRDVPGVPSGRVSSSKTSSGGGGRAARDLGHDQAVPPPPPRGAPGEAWPGRAPAKTNEGGETDTRLTADSFCLSVCLQIAKGAQGKGWRRDELTWTSLPAEAADEHFSVTKRNRPRLVIHLIVEDYVGYVQH